MIHPDTRHHETLSAIPFALATVTLLWPWLRAYLDRKETNDNTNEKDEAP